jgi:hypothetical protein
MLARGVHLDAASSTPAFEVQDSTRPARQARTRAVTAALVDAAERQATAAERTVPADWPHRRAVGTILSFMRIMMPSRRNGRQAWTRYRSNRPPRDRRRSEKL